MAAVLDSFIEVTQILEALYPEVNGYDFYREIFPDNEESWNRHNDYSHPNAIYFYWDEEYHCRRRTVMLKDTWEQEYMDRIEGCPNTLCGGLSYRRTANQLDNAQRMNALIFDLDGVGEHELRNLLHRFRLEPDVLRSLPEPTYLVASGTGVHLYYVFEEPIDLFPNIKVQLKSMKHDLTFKIWEYKATSTEKQIQYQSINQAFRMPGSLNEKYGNEIKAYRVGDRVSIDQLNRYVIKPENRVDLQKRFRPSKMSLEEAKLAYPDWYEKVIVRGEKRPIKWDIAGKVNGSDPYALYHWWLRQVDQIKGGHRYFFLMCMAIYAAKCDVPKTKLREDMEEIYKTLQSIEHKNPMKREDIKSALEAYSKEYYNFKLDDIEKLTDIQVKRNDRNYRKRKEHLHSKFWENDKGRPTANVCKQNRELALQYMRENGEVKGRPKGSKDRSPRKNKQELVQRYRRVWPKGSKADCARVTGLDPKTIRKWWDK